MQFVQAFRVSILNISRVCLQWNDVLRNGRGRERNFIEIGFDAMVSRDSLVRWVKMIFNDATISRLSSSISNELSLGCHPSESWTLSQFIFVHQRTLYTLFQDVFTYPCASWPFGHPRSHWPANYRHGSRARCVFLKRRYPLREIPISTVCCPSVSLYPRIGDGVALGRNGVSLKDRSRLDATSKQLW